MLSELASCQKLVGLKQCTKALKEGRAAKLFVARDAEERVTAPVMRLCEEQGVPVEQVDSMKELGLACHIDVSAAVVAVLK